LQAVGELIALVAEQCLASAFALWSQRMVLEYVAAAPRPEFPRERFLPRLLRADLLGSLGVESAWPASLRSGPCGNMCKCYTRTYSACAPGRWPPRAPRSGVSGVLRPELDRLHADLTNIEVRVRGELRTPAARILPMRSFVETRLAAARLAGAAARLEFVVHGGRAYRVGDPSNRRFREAAFVPVQAPTEAQLEWELARPA
jgi:hypothetical protein